MNDYFRRTGQPRDDALDGAFMYQRAVLRDLLERLEVIMDDVGAPREVTSRVIRHMLYGSPSVADAELRVQQDKRLAELAAQVPPSPVLVDEQARAHWRPA